MIKDNDHHFENVSVVAINGLNDLDLEINLTQGTKTTIRHLLLATPANTSNKSYSFRLKDNPRTTGCFVVSTPRTLPMFPSVWDNWRPYSNDTLKKRNIQNF
jgi:hypothetical protein